MKTVSDVPACASKFCALRVESLDASDANLQRSCCIQVPALHADLVDIVDALHHVEGEAAVNWMRDDAGHLLHDRLGHASTASPTREHQMWGVAELYDHQRV